MQSRRRQRAAFARTVLVGLALVLGTVGMPTPVAAQDEGADARVAALKAAYLRHIAEFTTWPKGTFDDPSTPIVIGVLEEDAAGVAEALARRIDSKGLSAQSRRIDLRVLLLDDTLATRLAGCHLLFVPGAREAAWETLQSLLAHHAIVTVSDIEGFSHAAGMIEFVFEPEENRIRMHIDLASVRQAGLKLSSRLLSLKQGVTIVRGEGRP